MGRAEFFGGFEPFLDDDFDIGEAGVKRNWKLEIRN
jgi:hypothetical protein